MSIISANNNIFYGLKSAYLNNILKLRDQNGKLFPHNVRRATMKTSCGHTLWFAETNGTWNRFFRKDGIDYIRENNQKGKWSDPADKAAEKFIRGEKAVRSVICRWVKNDGNRYAGEYQLVEINDEFRIWKCISTEVDLKTCA
ncbi:MAG: hypothetical protein J6W00_05145 [Lentisphaeria bacterium]|nr:hypothetical protein [Lentisphaeria bacterium]